MGRVAESHTVERSPHHSAAPAAEEVLLELGRISASPAFQGSRRSRQFLEHVCRRALAGEGASIKERTLAVEVFGRAAESDLGEDTIVRVGAREVRKRLVQYYATPESKESGVVIELPAGSYVPEFRYVQPETEAAGEEPLAPAMPLAPAGESPVSRRWLMLRGALAGAAVTAAAITGWQKWPFSEYPQFEAFWEPVFAAPEPLLVASSHPIVYHPSLRAHQLTDARIGPRVGAGQRAIDVDPNDINGNDLIPIFNQYIGFGDMIVATEIAAMLARRGKSYRVRWADSVPFADLRQGKTLLIGAITNRWTLEMGRRWRFQFIRTSDGRHALLDTAGTKEWRATAKDDGSTGDDYMLISRVWDSAAGGLILVAAGVKQFGTEAAGRILSDPAQLHAVLENLPAGWPSKNVQIVLHVKVIGNTPGQPAIVATHVW